MKKLIIQCAVILTIISVILLFSFGCQETPTAPEKSLTDTQKKSLIVPGRSHFDDARISFGHEIDLQAGETKSIEGELETRKDGPGKFSGTLYRVAEEYSEEEIPMPAGLEVHLEPPEFKAYPDNTYDFAIIIQTTPELAPCKYFLRFEFKLENALGGGGWIEVNVK